MWVGFVFGDAFLLCFVRMSAAAPDEVYVALFTAQAMHWLGTVTILTY